MALVKTHIADDELFHDLKAMDRNNFSYEGAKALMEYLEDLSENIEYDPIAFCCDFVEYSRGELPLLAAEYSNQEGCPQTESFEDAEAFEDALLDWLNDQTLVIDFNGGVIIQAF